MSLLWGEKPLRKFLYNVGKKKGEDVVNLTKTASRSGNWGSLREYTLRDAFVLWLKEAGSPSLAKSHGILYTNGMDYSQIYNIYILQRQKPKDMDDGDWLRMKGYAMENGQRLFAQFLEYGLTTEDRRKVEILWNSEFNSIKEFDVSRVPIGFVFSKWYGGNRTKLNDIRKEKRRAIGFQMLKGSSCFAYGVGMGKTWCSIFVIAQNLDMGICKKPLIVVPNQVYPQFSKEVQSIIPNYKLNMLYNCKGYFNSLSQKHKRKYCFYLYL